jgi:hypothetical protein
MSDTEDINIDDIKKIVNKMRTNSSIRKQVKKSVFDPRGKKEIYETNQDEDNDEQEQEKTNKKIPKAKDIKSKKPIKKTLDLTINDNEIDDIINIKTKTSNKPKDFKEYRDEDPRLKTFLDILIKKS